MDIPALPLFPNPKDYINLPRLDPELDTQLRYFYFPQRQVTLAMPLWAADATLPQSHYDVVFEIGRILIKVTDLKLPYAERKQRPTTTVTTVSLEDTNTGRNWEITSLFAQWILDIYFERYPEYQDFEGIYLVDGPVAMASEIYFPPDLNVPDPSRVAFGSNHNFAILTRIPRDSRKRSRLDLEYDIEDADWAAMDPRARAAHVYFNPDPRFERYNLDEYQEMRERR